MTFLMAQFTRLGIGAAEVYAGCQLVLYIIAGELFLVMHSRIPNSPELDADTILAAAASTPVSFGYRLGQAIANNTSPVTNAFPDDLFTPAPITVTFGTVSMIPALVDSPSGGTPGRGARGGLPRSDAFPGH